VEGEVEVRVWSGIEREEVRKKKENEGKRRKQRAEKPVVGGTVVPCPCQITG